ncbi:MAG TPA: SDR family NAD(P)-dependent oxidoreductase [Myxococcota bacterium]|jgi:NAD(P)-dependent dehydrogenase (short-subunit alcohol dehydrogenase family)|nr:SDR family NAD(P)-dependent oxidoreductase [Myxococcota bacterium]
MSAGDDNHGGGGDWKLFDLRGKAAVVTGGNGGIGLAIAHGLAAHGADVLIAARNEKKLADAAAALAVHGRRVVARRCDVLIDADLEACRDAAVEAFGGVDVLVNNAGVPSGMPVVHADRDVFQQAFAVNLGGTAAACRIFGPHLLERGRGSVINIASIWGIRAPRGTAAYAASKAGVIALTKVLAQEWASRGVRVNAIAPGLVNTEMTELMQDPETMAKLTRNIPMKRSAAPREVAGAAVYLASDAAAGYVTGTVIVVDGGTLARG